MLKINEIFYSLQGESTYAGLPCVFIRLAQCNLRCAYCDTQYAYDNFYEISTDEVLKKIEQYNCPLVEITGGEPLLQKETLLLTKNLCDKNYKVLIETNGSLAIKDLDKRAVVIMDIKCPSSGCSQSFLEENINFFKKIDQVKFVIADEIDYNWAKEKIKKYALQNLAEIIFSPVFGKIEPSILAQWILRDKINVRLQVQLHKVLNVK